MMADTKMIAVEKEKRNQSKIRKTVLSARVSNYRLKSPPKKTEPFHCVV